MSLNVVTLLYLVASVCFIQALKGLSHPTTARLGNISAWSAWRSRSSPPLALIVKQAARSVRTSALGLGLLLAALVVGGAVGAYVAAKSR